MSYRLDGCSRSRRISSSVGNRRCVPPQLNMAQRPIALCPVDFGRHSQDQHTPNSNLTAADPRHRTNLLPEGPWLPFPAVLLIHMRAVTADYWKWHAPISRAETALKILIHLARHGSTSPTLHTTPGKDTGGSPEGCLQHTTLASTNSTSWTADRRTA